MKKLLFIYNAHAGKGQLRSHLSEFLDLFCKAGYLTTVWPTQASGEATAVAERYAKRYDRVICAGGDGTLSEVIAGLLSLDAAPTLGYIPAGTTNDFSRNLSLPKGFVKMAETAAAGVPRPCDMGRFNDQFFVYVAAFGAFTDVAYDTPQPVKNTFGHFAYLMEGVTRLGTLKSYPLTVEYEGGSITGEFIFGMVSNTVSVGGFKGLPAKEVRLDDGLFEVVLVRTPKTPMELQSILLALARQSAVGSGGIVEAFHAAHLKLSCAEPLPWTLDGEYGGDPKTAEIENLKEAVTLVWGK